MPQRSFINRRTFLKGSLAAGAGLTIGVHLSALGRATAAVAPAGQTFAPNAWVRVGADGRMTLIVHKSEMGQGVLTSLPMLVAEELEVDLSRVHLEQAPVDPVYNRTGFGGGEMITGGSTSVRHSFEPLRRAGAAAREMLVAAAAETWGVSAASCTTANGVVSHRASGRSATYGELADKAARLPVPQHPKLKAPQTFTLIGRPVKRLDTPDKVRGRAIFGLDVTVPGMLIATVVRCPVIGGTAARFDASRAKAVPGVRHVVQIDSGVAVVADSFWAARQGQQALDVSWDEGANAELSSADISQLYAAAAQQPGVVVRHEGDAARALASAARTFEATYEVPYLAHAPMEPMNCTAHVRDEGCDIWGPIQAQTRAQQVAAKVTGLPPEAINVHTTLLGGGFGRRLDVDYVAEGCRFPRPLARQSSSSGRAKTTCSTAFSARPPTTSFAPASMPEVCRSPGRTGS